MHTPCESGGSPGASPSPDELPFVAPGRRVPASAPLQWLRLGWLDMVGAASLRNKPAMLVWGP